LQRVRIEHNKHCQWLRYRDYFSSGVLPVLPGEVYPVNVEIWPTNVIIDKGSKLIFEVSSDDTQGYRGLKHTDSSDRQDSVVSFLCRDDWKWSRSKAGEQQPYLFRIKILELYYIANYPF